MRIQALQEHFEPLPLQEGDRLIHPTSPGWGEVTDISDDAVVVWWFTGITHRFTLLQLYEAGFLRQDGTPLIQTKPTPQTPTNVSDNLPNKLPRSNTGSRIERKFFRRGDKVYGPYEYLRYESAGKSRSVYLGKAAAIAP